MLCCLHRRREDFLELRFGYDSRPFAFGRFLHHISLDYNVLVVSLCAHRPRSFGLDSHPDPVVVDLSLAQDSVETTFLQIRVHPGVVNCGASTDNRISKTIST